MSSIKQLFHNKNFNSLYLHCKFYFTADFIKWNISNFKDSHRNRYKCNKANGG